MSAAVWMLLAMVLHRPPELVRAVYEAGGVPFVALVSCENPRWDTEAVKIEPRGHTSYGLAMIDDEWWPQYRSDLIPHLAQGWWILHVRFGDDPAHYNGGDHPNAKAREWGKYVRDRERMLRRALAQMIRVRAMHEA